MRESPDISRNRTFRSIFISDVHLGTKHCQADLLVDFLESHSSENVYLIGDIIDGWRLKKRWYWPQAHDDVVSEILRRARLGEKIVYIPGNHDEFVRKFAGQRIENVKVLDRAVHQTADGRRYLVVHGDQYDVVIQNAKWMAYVGDRFYEFALTTNTWLNRLRGYMGWEYWSLGAFAKRHVKSFVNIIGCFENTVSEDVRRLDLDGVICGHIHHAMSRDMNGIHYVNTGDWVESCTAVAEHHDGTLEVIHWTQPARRGQPLAQIRPTPELDDRAS